MLTLLFRLPLLSSHGDGDVRSHEGRGLLHFARHSLYHPLCVGCSLSAWHTGGAGKRRGFSQSTFTGSGNPTVEARCTNSGISPACREQPVSQLPHGHATEKLGKHKWETLKYSIRVAHLLANQRAGLSLAHWLEMQLVFAAK